MPQKIIDLLNEGIHANNSDRFRQNNVIHLPEKGRLVIAGDIHGNQRNLERIINFADLPNNPDTHLVLQEIIHGGEENQDGGCLSYKILFDVVRYKIRFPDRLHILMGNHDTAVINNSEVMKSGKEMNRAMRLALEQEFEHHTDDIELAIRQYLFSQPLAARSNKIWMSHSLPSDHFIDKFDPTIMERYIKVNDVVRPGSVYLLTWGRRHSQQLLDKMAEMFNVDIFILGHQTQKQGWAQMGENLIILASEHAHGCLMEIDMEKSYTIDDLKKCIIQLASIY